MVDGLTWSIIESGCYLVAACLPTYRPFFVALMKKLKMHPKTGQSKKGTGRSGFKTGEREPEKAEILRTTDWNIQTEPASK
jgi:hypothetical protein